MISDRWWTDPALNCPPEVALEFEEREKFASENQTTKNSTPLSRGARRIMARWMDRQADLSEKNRNTPTHYTQIKRDLEDTEGRFLEREFERVLKRESDKR